MSLPLNATTVKNSTTATVKTFAMLVITIMNLSVSSEDVSMDINQTPLEDVSETQLLDLHHHLAKPTNTDKTEDA